MLRYLTVPVTAFAQNCSIVWCDDTLDAAVIDPGGDLERLLAEVQRLGLTLKAIWQTHAHIDHAGGTGTLARTLGLPIVGPHPGDQFWIDGLPQQSQMFGFPPAGHFTPTRWLADCIRGRKLVPVEFAVKMMTSQPAKLFGLVDRGELREGAFADVVVFNPDEIGSEDAMLVTDLPGNSSRLTAGSFGVKRVLVNGVTIVENGVANGAVPGTVLKSGKDTYTVPAR